MRTVHSLALPIQVHCVINRAKIEPKSFDALQCSQCCSSLRALALDSGSSSSLFLRIIGLRARLFRELQLIVLVRVRRACACCLLLCVLAMLVVAAIIAVIHALRRGVLSLCG